MGTGLINRAFGRAVASGISGAAGAGGAMMGMQIKMDMEEEKLRRIAEYKQVLDRQNKVFELDEGERRQAGQAGKLSQQAGIIASGRTVASPETEAQADAAASAYNGALSRGEISQEDANTGYAAAADYRNSNATPDTNITTDDRIQAAIELGQISPKDMATLRSAEKSETNKLTHEGLRQSRQDARTQSVEDRRDARAQTAEDARDARLDKRLGAKENLSSAQKVRNAEIEFSRGKIAGLSPEEIKKRTSSYTATGRTNPDYDPQLASRVKRAQQRKHGDDPWFDEQIGGEQIGSANSDIEAEFRTDPAMKGHSLGQETDKGFEVLDASGKLVGHYTR